MDSEIDAPLAASTVPRHSGDRQDGAFFTYVADFLQVIPIGKRGAPQMS
jgi:hypothetical protein